MRLISILGALSSTLAALALSANAASAETRPIHPTVAPKVTPNPPPPAKNVGGEGVYYSIPLSNVSTSGYKTNHGTTGGATEGRHRKE
jgi:hypothetical protein